MSLSTVVRTTELLLDISSMSSLLPSIRVCNNKLASFTNCVWNYDLYKVQDYCGEYSFTKLANSLSGRHSPKALSKVVTFFLGSGRDNARIIGL